MASPLIISVSGLRGVVGKSLTPLVAQTYALAASSCLSKDGPILIARDSRQSGIMLARALTDALTAAGRNVLDVGIAATPTVGLLVKKFNGAGGIQISASHNPIEFNGLKIFSDEGRIVSRSFGETILKRYHEESQLLAEHELAEQASVPVTSEKKSGSVRPGSRRALSDTIQDHLQAVLRTVDVERIRACRFRVLLDSNHGAGSILGLPLLAALGCVVVPCGEEPNGQFDHVPEPIEENLKAIGHHVLDSQVDAGFCQDPDADRLAVFDATGHYCGEEYTLALCVLNRLEKAREGSRPAPPSATTLVINCATSRMTCDLATRFGLDCQVAPVGEANVVDRMEAVGALYGGEGNGGPIDPEVGYVRDSFVGMAQILDLMARRRQSLREICQGIRGYTILKRKVALDLPRTGEILDQLTQLFPRESVSRQDGLRIDWNDRWVLVRASNTEPIIRVIAEADNATTASELCCRMEQYITQIGDTLK